MSFHQRRRIIYAKREGQSDSSKIKLAILSPDTDRLMAEDILGANLYKRLKRMLEKDTRLSPDMRLIALLGVLKRRDELDSKTLSDVATEEAEKAIRKTADKW